MVTNALGSKPIGNEAQAIQRAIRGWHYPDAPIFGANWNGDAKTDSDFGIIDLSVQFTIPAGVKAVQVRFIISALTADINGMLGSSASNIYLSQYTQVSNQLIETDGVVVCDANGDIYFKAAGSLSNDLSSVWIIITGWYI